MSHKWLLDRTLLALIDLTEDILKPCSSEGRRRVARLVYHQLTKLMAREAQLSNILRAFSRLQVVPTIQVNLAELMD
jgi:hypothetical protein